MDRGKELCRRSEDEKRRASRSVTHFKRPTSRALLVEVGNSPLHQGRDLIALYIRPFTLSRWDFKAATSFFDLRVVSIESLTFRTRRSSNSTYKIQMLEEKLVLRKEMKNQRWRNYVRFWVVRPPNPNQLLTYLSFSTAFSKRFLTEYWLNLSPFKFNST